MISVITTNIFQGHDHIKLIIKNLALQTYKEFEWVFVDAFYEENKQLVSDLMESSGLRPATHVPFCAASHVGRSFHWEVYNNALLLSQNNIFLRLGVFRYFHHEIVEYALKNGIHNTWLSLTQRDVNMQDLDIPHEEIVNRNNMELNTHTVWNQMVSHCGMFSFSRQKMIEINGNNEALLIHHWEDVDLNCRCNHLGSVHLLSLERAFLRVHHSKGNPFLAKRHCESGPDCIAWAKNSHELTTYASPATEWGTYRDFPWARCRTCGTIAVGFCDKYFEYLKNTPASLIAPINVFGVGRNIRILEEDISKLDSLSSKVELLTNSHTNSRYLQE